MPKYKASLKNQKITLKDALVDMPVKKPVNRFVSFDIVIILLITAIILWVGVYTIFKMTPFRVDATYDPFISCDCRSCHTPKAVRKVNMIKYFQWRKNPHPEQMAEAVLNTKTPRLLAAIAVAGEKNTPYTARKTGYKKRHSGAWQVSEKDWGKVPYTPKEQAKQAEDILLELTSNKPIQEALSHYGGDSTDAYQKRVLAEFKNVPK